MSIRNPRYVQTAHVVSALEQLLRDMREKYLQGTPGAKSEIVCEMVAQQDRVVSQEAISSVEEMLEKLLDEHRKTRDNFKMVEQQ